MSREDMLMKILRANGRVAGDISGVEIRKPDGAAPNYTCITESVTVNFKDNKEPLHLFMKRVGEDSAESQKRISEAFNNKEVVFLTIILPEIREFVRCKIGLSGKMWTFLEDGFARVYYGDCQMIIMEDLRERGYFAGESVTNDFSIAKLALEQLAQFHSATFAWIQSLGGSCAVHNKYPELYEIQSQPDTRDAYKVLMDEAISIIYKLLKKSAEPGAEETALKLERYGGQWYDAWIDSFQKRSIFEVLSNGDFNQNNMMFKNESGVTSHIMFIDYQMSRLNSPNADLSHYFCIGLTPEVQRRWKELMQIYFAKLKDSMELLCVDCPCTIEELMEDFVRKSGTGFIFGIFSRTASLMFNNYDASANGGLNVGIMLGTLRTNFMENMEAQQEVVKIVIPLVQEFLFDE